MEIAVASLAPAAWVVTGGAALLAGGVGIILALHWFRFGTNRFVAMTALAVYAGVAILFLGSLALLVSAMTA